MNISLENLTDLTFVSSSEKEKGVLEFRLYEYTVCVYEEYHLLGYVATCLLAGFAELISSTLKMEAICSS
jgi:hypothetical protein